MKFNLEFIGASEMMRHDWFTDHCWGGVPLNILAANITSGKWKYPIKYVDIHLLQVKMSKPSQILNILKWAKWA